MVRIIMGDSMSVNLQAALNEGINAEAVGATLNDIINRSDELGKTPSQIKDVVEAIIFVKKNVNSIPDKRYESNVVINNSEAIKKALKEGMSSEEIKTALMVILEKANNRRNKNSLRLITKFIKKTKQKDLTLQNENHMEKGRQKVLVNNYK